MPKTETISIRILKLLNLENEFEMSYDEYARNLKELLLLLDYLSQDFRQKNQRY